MGSNPTPSATQLVVRPGHMGHRTYLRLSNTFGPGGRRGAAEFFLKIDLTEIVVHKADQPNTLVDFLQAYGRTSKDRPASSTNSFE